MVVDASALLAILFKEEGYRHYVHMLATVGRKVITPFNLLEAEIVIQARKGDKGHEALELLMLHAEIEAIPFSSSMSSLALEAWKKFGKSRHPAALNMGDCCAYALAVHLSEPLLFTGNDFSQTDVTPALR